MDGCLGLGGEVGCLALKRSRNPPIAKFFAEASKIGFFLALPVWPFEKGAGAGFLPDLVLGG